MNTKLLKQIVLDESMPLEMKEMALNLLINEQPKESTCSIDSTRSVDGFGTVIWTNKVGLYHRTDGPACDYSNGSKEWYLNKKLHRTDGPAVESPSGDKFWYLNNDLHRIDGPAIEYTNGTKKWYLNGKLHRTDGPAVESPSGDKFWYLNDVRHRTDGPAVEFPSGDKFWYLNGTYIPTEEEFKNALQRLEFINSND